MRRKKKEGPWVTPRSFHMAAYLASGNYTGKSEVIYKIAEEMGLPVMEFKLVTPPQGVLMLDEFPKTKKRYKKAFAKLALRRGI